MSADGIVLYSTCPPSNKGEAATYLAAIGDTARWSERAGCTGMLVYTDNGLIDPWLGAQAVIGATQALVPLVAVQPAYLHPYSAAKMVTSLAFLHGRRVALNMVAGGFTTDLEALDDRTPHDQRYERLIEYTTLLMRLLSADAPVTHAGTHYRVTNLRLRPPLPAALLPEVFVSGSSPAGLAAARALNAVAVQYPRPAHEYQEASPAAERTGIRIGLVARSRAEDAWQAARDRFPEDRRGQITHQLAMKVSDSHWHEQLSALARSADGSAHPYWLHPFENYKTFCPYLVGDYDRVADEIVRYLRAGYRTFILDVPASPEELGHVGVVFERARAAWTR